MTLSQPSPFIKLFGCASNPTSYPFYPYLSGSPFLVNFTALNRQSTSVNFVY